MQDSTTREIVLEVLDRLRSEAALRDVIRDLEFIYGVEEGFAQLNRGKKMPIEEAVRSLQTGTRPNPLAAMK